MPSPCPETPHSRSQFSPVGIASQKDSHRSLSEDKTRIHSMEYETIKIALMTPPLTFSLFCVKNRLSGAKQIAGLLCLHKQRERKKEEEISQLADSCEILCS